MGDILYTSNTAVELNHLCRRARFLAVHYKGTGIVPKAIAIPLATGLEVHHGVEHIMRVVKAKQLVTNKVVSTAIVNAQQSYMKMVETSGISGDGLNSNAATYHTVTEQMALIEAFVLAWAMVELPRLLARFNIAGVEQEILIKRGGVGFQSRADAILQEKGSGDVYVYSLKTLKYFDKRAQDNYRENLQGIHETFAVEEFLRAKGLGKRVMGVRFCIFVKGNRKEDKWSSEIKENRRWVTYNPLIRGYRRVGPMGYQYAHTWEYADESKPSGKTVIGNTYKPFFIWQDPSLSVAKWVRMIRDGQVQPEAGNVLEKTIVTPLEYFRNDREIQRTVRSTFNDEGRIKAILDNFVGPDTELDSDLLDLYFPQHRRACHYPSRCAFHPICFKPEVAIDPLATGLYVRRQPHHLFEADSFREEYGAE